MDPVLLRTVITWAAGLMIAAGVGGGGLMLTREAQMMARRHSRLRGEQPSDKPVLNVAAGAATRMLKGASRVGNHMATRDPAQLSELRLKLIQAGYMSREAVGVYLGAKFTALAVATVAAVLTLPWIVLKGGDLAALALVAAIAIAGVIGPEKVLDARRREREAEYRDGFPDVLDLLVASVEAGLSLDAAVNRVTDEMTRRHPNLAEQLRILTLELRAGRSRKEAWQALADRLGLEEARAFATMLRQTEEMGTSLGETLSVFSDEMRAKRMLRAEEKAMALPAKLIVPLILFIFPCLLGVLILPAGYRIIQQFGGQ